MEEYRTMLVVDDEPAVCELIAERFSYRGYDCQTANSGRRALSLFEEVQPKIVLTDIQMPDMDGLDLTRDVLTARPETTVILMTGRPDVETAIKSFRLGASDFLIKPFDFKTLERSVRQAAWKKQALQNTEMELTELKQILKDLLKQNKAVAVRAMESFCKLLEMRDIETFAHAERVSLYACWLARKMGLSAKEQKDIRIGALLHDIGKVVVPERIFLKAGPLNEEEWLVMQKHVEAGYRVIDGIPGLEGAAQIVLHHHERFGGGGYPAELVGEEICLGARIFAVADTYDALTTARPYRPAQSDPAAREEIQKQSGQQFDPKVVEAFLAIPIAEWIRIGQQGVTRSCGVGMKFGAGRASDPASSPTE